MKHVLFIALLAAFMLQGLFGIGFTSTFGINFQNIVFYVVLITLAILEVASGRIKEKKIPFLLILTISFSWICANILITQTAGSKSISLIPQLRHAKRLFFDPFMLYITSFLLIDNKDHARNYFLWIIIVFSTLNALILISQFISPNQTAIEYGRYQGFGNANKTAYLLAFFLPYTYYLLKIYRKFVIKILFFGIIVASIITVALSGSRGGVLSVGLVLFSMTIVFRDFKISMLMILLIPLLALLLWDNPYLIETINRFSQLFEKSLADASSSRFDIWESLIKVLLENPLFLLTGTGFGSADYLGTGAAAHNIYLKITVELGIIGLLIWLGLIFSVFFRIIRINVPDEWLFKSCLIISISVIFFAWMFSVLFGIQNYIALTFGTAMAYLIHSNGSISKPSRSNLDDAPAVY